MLNSPKKILFSTINSQSNDSVIYRDRDDLLLAVFPEDTIVAGVFTKSQTRAFCVDWSMDNIVHNPKALIVNAGNANACTGKDGEVAVYNICHEVASNIVGCQKEEVLMCSTGVIGAKLPYEKINQKIPFLISQLSDTNFTQAAKAILTTDSKEKIAEDKNDNFEIRGFAKGSGMVEPNMATILVFIFTDINIEQEVLQEILKEVNEKTFNSITVDGDCSTNDTVLLFSTNEAKNNVIKNKNNNLAKLFKESLEKVMTSLAKQIIRDAEGATKTIEVNVSSANSHEDAKKIAKSVANSPLVKTAIAGCDANWGRIMMAIGKAEVDLAQENISILIGGSEVVKNGLISSKYNERQLTKYLEKESEIKIEIDLQNDPFYKKIHQATVWGCDLTKKYIEINADYRS